MINGAWVLPETEPHADFLGQLRDVVLQQGGTVFVLRVSVSSPEVHDTIIRRFQADRGREYDEFAERCTALLSELDKETRAGKHTFAEMEENEQDLEKLVRWLAKIQARDFFPDEQGSQSAGMLAQCRSAVEAFSQAVYAAEELTGLDPTRVHGKRLTRISRGERLVHDERAVQRQAGRGMPRAHCAAGRRKASVPSWPSKNSHVAAPAQPAARRIAPDAARNCPTRSLGRNGAGASSTIF